MLIKRINITVILFSLPLLLAGQLNTNSVYSRFGIGEIERKGFGFNRSMGNIAFGVRNNQQINYLNPASYSAQDTNSFLIDFGFIGKRTNHQTNSLDYQSNIINIDHVAIAFPLSKFWNTSIGVMPFSRIGYQINNISSQYGYYINRAYLGSGGINRFYFGNSIELFDRLSIGLNASYLFGYAEHEKIIDYNDLQVANSHVINETTIGGFYFDGGLQYQQQINENLEVIVGVVYNNKSKINTEVSEQNISRLYLSNGYLDDTSEITFENRKSSFSLPSNYGFGISAVLYDKLMIGLDIYHQNWNTTPSTSDNVYQTHNLYNVGLQYTPDKDAFRWYWKKIHYRVGGFYRPDYIAFDDSRFENQTFYNHSINDLGITFGVGLPFKNTNTTFNFAYEYGIRGTTKHELVKENYNLFTISMTLYDIWFIQSKYD